MSHDVASLKEMLLRLAGNLWWTWNAEAVDLWRRIDPALWRESRHSPAVFLRSLDSSRLEALARDPAHMAGIHRVLAEQRRYLERPDSWCTARAGPLRARPVAYFSAEFGIHESLPLYSGGLGVLAGDHLKSSSDLGVPMVGVSLFYREGYFRQVLGDSGEQTAQYEVVDPESLSLSPVLDGGGSVISIEIPLQGKIIQMGSWWARLGRASLYFLDVEGAVRDLGIQSLASRLYAGDDEIRLSQEAVLGIGGMRLLLRLGIAPGVIHLNEGHSALAPLEYARFLMSEHHMSFEEAFRQASSRTVFTTHTPVPAGHDRFSSDLVGRLLWRYEEALGLSHEAFMGLGRVRREDPSEPFCMTVLALRMAGMANAVSSIHGKVSRRMWSGLWPGRSPQEVPIGHITNGINVRGWLAPAMRELFDRYLPAGWESKTGEEDVWRLVHTIPDEELWDAILLLKSHLIGFIPRLPHRAHPVGASLSPNVLTVGFARRFAVYKRPDLLLRQRERLLGLLTDEERPVQIVFSGKAHPRDDAGRDLVRRVHEFAVDPRSRGRAIFIEDYDMNVCRHLVQGVDLWLNTPRHGYEASGTSGMKVALNGGLNLSILDGWWPEGYDGSNGFAVSGSRDDDFSRRDARDGDSIFRVLEEQVVPEFYDKDEKGLPRAWLRRVRRAMCTLGWRFSSDRMVMDYVENCYRPAAGIATSQMKGPFT